MPVGAQKNVRLSEVSAETLRALKYDLDASDGEVVALALERKAIERLRHHDAVVKRARLGMVSAGEGSRSAVAMAALTAALNLEAPRFTITAGRLVSRPGLADYGDRVQAAVQRAPGLARALGLTEVSPAVLLLACCEAPGAERFAGLGVSAAALAGRLREALRGQADPSLPADRPLEEIPFTWPAKSLLVEGASGIATLDGIGGVDVEHVLAAALQSDDGVVASARAALGIDADTVRALLCAGPPEAAPGA